VVRTEPYGNERRLPRIRAAGTPRCQKRFNEAWYRGEVLVTTVLVKQGGKTILTFTVLYESL